MKKYIFVPLMAIAIISTGCKSKPQQATTADSTVVAEDDTLMVDSIVYHAQQDSTISSDIRVDYPTGDDSLSVAVCHFIAQQLAKNFLPVINDMEHKDQHPLYKGEITKGQAVVDFYGKGTLDYLIDEQKELKETMESNEQEGFTPQIPYMTNELNIRKSGEAPQYVTYRITGYTYLGGAHGSSIDYSINIDKRTNQPLHMTVDTLKVKELQPLIRKGIVSYIREQGQDSEVNDKNLSSYLLIEGNTIPLPAFTPYLAKDGVHFAYQQYEIGPYAMGIIEFTIPYSDIKPYLCPEAQKLIAQ